MSGLVLTLKPGRKVFITVGDQEVEVQFVQTESEGIRLRFIADKNTVTIDREEVHNKKKTAQQEESARIDVGSANRRDNP